MIPVAVLAERLSKILGRPIDRKQFLLLPRELPEDRVVLEAMARMLDVEVDWLIADVLQ